MAKPKAPATKARSLSAGSGDEVYISTVTVPTGGMNVVDCTVPIYGLPPYNFVQSVMFQYLGEPGSTLIVNAFAVEEFPKQINSDGTIDINIHVDIDAGNNQVPDPIKLQSLSAVTGTE